MLDQPTPAHFDETPVPGTTLDDLNIDEVEKHLAHALRVNRYPGEARTAIDMLVEQRAVMRVGVTYVPTVAGMLVFGRFPQRYLPHATVTLVHYQGDIVHSGQSLHLQDYSGTIRDQIDRAAGYLTSAMHTGYTILDGQVQRKDQPQYPVLALRELSVNSIVHRDYEIVDTVTRVTMFRNKIAWTNPGGLVAGVTIETIRERQKARNPTLLRLLWQRSYVERVGQGLDTAFAECRAMGLPDPAMNQRDDEFTVVVVGHELIGPATSANRPPLKEPEREIVVVLQRAKRALSAPEILDRLAETLLRPRSKRAVQRDLLSLLDAGIVERRGNSVASTYQLVAEPGES